MRIKNKKSYYLKRKTIVEDNEGGKYEDFEDREIEIQANIWPTSGGVQATVYGEKLNYMNNMLYDGDIELKEGDGICVYVPMNSKPDYRIKSIKTYGHKFIELEKI